MLTAPIDFQDRLRREQLVIDGLATLKQRQGQRFADMLARGHNPTDADWERNQKELAAAMLLLLLPVHERAAREFSTSNLANRQAAEQWAVDYANQAAAEINATTRREVEAAIDKRDKQAAALALLLMFGPQRAKSIGITETTRAITAGQRAGLEIYRGADPRSLGIEIYRPGKFFPPDESAILVPVWQTAEDERVCEVCRPLDGKRRVFWERQFPIGPPAHPRCRCELRYIAARAAALQAT